MTHLEWFKKYMLLAGFMIGSSAQAQVSTPIDASYKLTFDEEFNGTAVDGSKWGTNWLGSPGAITKPINSGEIGAYDPAQVSVAGGYLRLAAIEKTVRASDGRTYNYVSGIVQSHRKFEQAFGYIEARVFFPGSGGRIWNFPAFWMNGDHARYGESWPYAGELDIVEGLGGGVARYHFHSPTTGAGGGPSGDFTGWHVYGALWEPGSVTFYYDGVQVGRLTSGITSFPMYLILNNGISDEHGGATVVPSTMMVDYVHVYSRDPNAVAVTPQAGYGGPGDTGGGQLPPDTTAPSAPQGLIGQSVSPSQINLSWAASTDNVAVTSYRVYQNAIQVATVQTRAYSSTGLAASTRYTYTVRASDAAGNLSSASAPVDVTTMAVSTPPPPPPPPPSESNNLLLNPGFEAGLTGWTVKGTASVQSTSSSSPAQSGTRSAYIASGGSAVEQVVGGLSPNTTYTLSAYVRRGASRSNVALGVKDFGGSQVAYSAPGTSYVKLTLRFRTGANSSSARIFFYSNSGSGRADTFELRK